MNEFPTVKNNNQERLETDKWKEDSGNKILTTQEPRPKNERWKIINELPSKTTNYRPQVIKNDEA